MTDIETDRCKSLVWESHVRQQFFVVFDDFYRQKQQNPVGFDNIYSDNQRVSRQR